MTILEKICISFLFLFSGAGALIQLDIIKRNDKFYAPPPQLFLEVNEKKSVTLNDIIIEATLQDEKTISFNLAYKDEQGNIVVFYDSGLLAIQSGDEIDFRAKDNSFALLMYVTQVDVP